jgi:DNA-binding NarL/FixJ family response regulator
MTIRILIADDHQNIRNILRLFLSMDPELEIIGEAADGNAAIELTRQNLPDVVLMDVSMPGLDGIAATAVIRKELPEVEVVALTSVLDNAVVLSAIKAGAIGYQEKNINPIALTYAIHAAAAGQVQLSPKEAEFILTQLRLPISDKSVSTREIDVIRLIAAGKSNEEIAQNLQMNKTMAKTFVNDLLKKLNLVSRTQAALYACQYGYISKTSD